MTKYECDRCHVQRDAFTHPGKFSFTVREGIHHITRQIDLCASCVDDVVDFIGVTPPEQRKVELTKQQRKEYGAPDGRCAGCGAANGQFHLPGCDQ